MGRKLQIIFSKNILILVLYLLIVSFGLTVFFGCQMDKEDAPAPLVVPEPVLYGTVSGMVVDVNTKNPLTGAVVKLFGLEVKTELDGVFTFLGIPYNETQTLTVHDPDYEPYTKDIIINIDRFVVDVTLTPLIDPEDDLNTFLDTFSELVESLDPENIPAIQALFSESYVAADDPVTTFGVLSGVVPPNYEGVIPTVVDLFQEYALLEFIFRDKEMDITDARKASVELLLDVNSEGAEDQVLRHLVAHSLFEFRREGADWKIVYWQLLGLDIGL